MCGEPDGELLEVTIPYSTGLSLRQAMAAAGGPTPHAAEGAGFIIRADADRVSFDAAALWDGDGLNGDLPLQARDQIVVPAEVFVTVLGEVNRPGVIPFQG